MNFLTYDELTSIDRSPYPELVEVTSTRKGYLRPRYVWRRCPTDGERFIPLRQNQLYCTTSCRYQVHNKALSDLRAVARQPVPCQYCGRTFEPNVLGQVYCTANCTAKATRNRSRSEKRKRPMQFIGVDGEGITLPTGEHRYVLLGCGDKQITEPDGLRWEDIFQFLYYDCFEANRSAAYVMFFAAYDWTFWLKSLPENRARLLLTREGKAKRTMRKVQHATTFTFPVRLRDYKHNLVWEVDMLGPSHIRFRPKRCQHDYCKCKAMPYMHICDAGPFFQKSFLQVIDPRKAPEPVCTQEEYDAIAEGKERRSDAILDDTMRRYNVKENQLLAKVMAQLDLALRELGVKLDRTRWYGPGSIAADYLKSIGFPRREYWESQKAGSAYVDIVAKAAYYGGWFETIVHGVVPGASYEYDISSAYPYIMSNLLCFEHGTWRRNVYKALSNLPPMRSGEWQLVYARVHGSNPYLGAMLHRRRNGSICRPQGTEGWYWRHELEAAMRAGLIDELEVSEALSYKPCDCPPPLGELAAIYNKYRLDDMGRKVKSPLANATKLLLNSIYGKFAQSVGAGPYRSYRYASLITAGTRTMILDAIANHPGGASDVLMIATDAVFFRSRDVELSKTDSDALGGWEEIRHDQPCIFKPGHYWDKESHREWKDGKAPVFKARGVKAKDFAPAMAKAQRQFAAIAKGRRSLDDWPTVEITPSFAFITATQALQRHSWRSAGNLAHDPVLLNANPCHNAEGKSDRAKRTNPYLDGGLIRSRPQGDLGRSEAYRVGAEIDDVERWLASLAGEELPDNLADMPVFESPDGPWQAIFFGQLGTGQWAD